MVVWLQKCNLKLDQIFMYAIAKISSKDLISELLKYRICIFRINRAQSPAKPRISRLSLIIEIVWHQDNS